MAQDLIEKIRAAAQAKGVDPEVAVSIARAESGLDPNAKAKSSSASGLFQILNSTWSGNKGTPGKQFDSDENIRVGTDIISKNVQSLKGFLGRDPSPKEVYAAHYFGATGAQKFLTAAPDTPAKQLFSEKVLAANPNLQGKTAAQILAQLEGKLKIPASNVSRETSVAKKEREPLPASLPPMAQADIKTPSVKPEAAARVASLGPGYQAALALSFLADTDDEEDRKTTITQEYLAKAQEDEDDLAAAAAVSKRQANVFADLSNTTIRSPFAEPQQPVRMKDGGEVEQERLTPQQIERIAAQGPTERKDDPFFDAASRTYVDVLTGRREPITAKDFTAKEQMAMMDAVRRSQARGGKGRVDYEDYPDSNTAGPGYVDIRNTLGGFQYKQGLDGSTIITDKYDFHGPRVAEYEKMGSGEKLVKSAKNALVEFVGKGFSPRDLAGELGRAYVGSKGPDVNIRIPVGRAEGSPEEGEVAPRLTMQQIERLAAQEAAAREAASTPAFIAQKSGIGRKAGNISNALNTGTAYPAIAAGAMDLPYDLAGLPVDLTTMAMRPFGYSDQKPVFGSEYFKDLATEAGIRRPTPTDPTLKGFHTFGQVGAGVLAPGKIIQGAQALKGAAAEALAGFKAGRAEKPGMTDLMTGQRFEATPLTPQQQAEQQTVAALFDNLAGANQQQIAADVAAGRLPAYVAPQLSYAEVQAQNIARLPQDAQEQLRLFEEAAARPRPVAIRRQGPRPEIVQPPPATVAITQPATKLPPPPPFVAPPVSAEFPFVGRLDEFAAGMKGPAQKEQLINQVKGKFREQDVARLEEALSGLGPKDKVTPAMLQDALANTYSPSRYRSAEITATSPMYQDVDNVFSQNKPIAGSMNLYLKESPESMALYDNYLGIKAAAQKAFTSTKPEEINLALDSLRNNPLSLKVPEINGLIDRVEEALPTITRFGKMRQDLNDVETMILYPVIYKGNGFEFFPEATRRAQLVGQGMDPAQYMRTKYDILKQEESKLIEELMQKGSDKLVALGGNPIDVKSFMQRHADDPSLYHSAGTDDVIKEHIKNNVTPINDGINAALSKVRDNIANVALNVDEKLKPFTGYAGRHRQVTGGDNMPIGFSRFTEHAVDIDGRQLKGRHVHELQSDLSRDIRELGPKGGALEKDQAELATLKSKLAEVDELDPTQKIEKVKLDKRVKALEDRVAATSPGKYSLEQPFAGFETNSPVRMQLLIKNAIQSSIRSGQDFVTFPGKESKQAQLYEKLLPNLKQAVKDLGGEKAGFEIKPITLPNPGGTEPTVWGVIWSPNTAAKAIEKGVPFNKGGMVERKANDNRRYL